MSRTYRCLLIEDDPDDQEIFLDVLESISSRIACYAVSNGAEGLALLTERQFVPDLVVTDLNMPIMGGREFLIEMKKREELQNIPVIVYSSYNLQDDSDQWRKLGAHDVHHKTNLKRFKSMLKNYFK